MAARGSGVTGHPAEQPAHVEYVADDPRLEPTLSDGLPDLQDGALNRRSDRCA